MTTLSEFAKHLITEHYKSLVQAKRPDYLSAWPLVRGYVLITYTFNDWIILTLKNSSPGFFNTSGGYALPQAIIGFSEITHKNINAVRENIKKYAGIDNTGGVLIFHNDGSDIDCTEELSILLKQHELSFELAPMKIFLSHKSEDKIYLVRDYKQTLHLLGFDPWIDEDAMVAGTKLERGVLQGFKDSCAVVFFITENFKDEKFLATEIDYALRRTREDNNFAIITIVFGKGLCVPELLRPYVWKNVESQLEGLREILKALPLSVGPVYIK